ncbi:hypothetical protein RRG08_011184 [Elysia crispata]|uniref:Uncharacterized protein n=1 Tax=Elysia crispata TaxID=231223 RepID=A0AAE1CWG9_9GAST|nr:hypothetical protein RRG08_011184 [Elysia crispata]
MHVHLAAIGYKVAHRQDVKYYAACLPNTSSAVTSSHSVTISESYWPGEFSCLSAPQLIEITAFFAKGIRLSFAKGSLFQLTTAGVFFDTFDPSLSPSPLYVLSSPTACTAAPLKQIRKTKKLEIYLLPEIHGGTLAVSMVASPIHVGYLKLCMGVPTYSGRFVDTF